MRCDIIPIVCLALLADLSPAAAQGTAFTYEGRLSDSGSLANGLYDFDFQVFDAASAGSSYGGIVGTNGVSVTNGLFTVVLDFGTGVFTGPSRWLQISVSTNNANNYSVLTPRQQLLPTPYAVFAAVSGSVTNGAITTAQLAAGAVGNSQIQSGAVSATQIAAGQVVKTLNGLQDNVTLNPGPNITINTAGNSLQISAPNTGGWGLTGNSGTTAGVNFIGTTDATPLDLRAGGARGLELHDGSRSTGFLSGIEGMNFIGGSSSNFVGTGVLGATIAGGGYSYGSFLAPTFVNNAIYSDLGAIGGGSGNVIGQDSPGSVVAGGSYNADWNGSTNSFIGGGSGNQVYATYSSIAGGSQNTIGSVGQYNFIGGGSGNLVEQSASAVVLAGGIGNFAGPDGYGTSYASVVAGGHNNNADGDYSVVPGGDSNWSPGAYSFAAGRRAKATAQGQFVWADSQNVDFFPVSYYGTDGYTSDSFCVRARGGVLFSGTSSFSSGSAVIWIPGSGSWAFTSDRNAKDRFSEVDPQSVLERVSQLPISEWSYKGYPQRHIGPMAQDFHELFPLNKDDRTLNELDLHGVALTAIKGLNQKVDSEIVALRAENAGLKQELDQLKQLVNQLNQKINGGAK